MFVIVRKVYSEVLEVIGPFDSVEEADNYARKMRDRWAYEIFKVEPKND